MSWIAIIAVALFGIGLAAVAIAAIENHRRLAPIAARWEFALCALFGVVMASSAWDHWSRGETYAAVISAAFAGMLLFVAVATFRKGRRASTAAPDPPHERSGR